MRIHLLFSALLFLFPLYSQAQKDALRQIFPVNGAAVGRYETIELGFAAPGLAGLIANFYDGAEPALNPFDPTQVKVKATFVSGAYAFERDGYYMQNAFADESVNRYVAETASLPWRIRFAPPDTGEWVCRVQWSANGIETRQLPEFRFRCISSGKHGALRIHENKMSLVHEDKTPFFAIGQNIAWADIDELKGRPGPPPVYTSGYYDIYHYLHHISETGGNYARIVLVEWSMNFEWEKAGKYSQERAAVLDSIFRIAEQRNLNLQLSLIMMVHHEDQWGWKNHPYRKLVPPGASQTALLTDSLCRVLEKNRFRYFFSRWGYSPQLASIELISEQDHWPGYSDDLFIPWMKDMVSFIRSELHSPVIISTCFGPKISSRVFDQPEMQVTSRHSYHNERLRNQRRYRQVHANGGLRRKWEKPALFAEMGVMNGPGNNCDADDFMNCNDIVFHNDLWATAFMGMYGAGLNWWQWKNDAYRAANYPALAAFVNNYNMALFERADYFDSNDVEAYYVKRAGFGKGCVVGWVHNKTYWWGNVIRDDCKDRAGRNMPLPKDDDKAAVPVDKEGSKLLVRGLKSRWKCSVVFYSTREPGKVISRVNARTDLAGRLSVPIPAGSDFAFEVNLQGPGKF